MNAEERTYCLRAVVYFDRGWWVVQCLEYDFCAASKQREDLPRKLMAPLRGQIVLDTRSGKRPLENLPKAPERFWKLYEQGTPVQFVLQEPWFVRLARRIRRRPEFRPEIALALA